MTVVETGRFLKDADRLIPEPDRARLVEFIAANPEAGDVIPETGGPRKLRWALAGGGKRGGARVIYLFHNESLPVARNTALLSISAQHSGTGRTVSKKSRL